MLAYPFSCLNNMVYSPFETYKPCVVGQVLFLHRSREKRILKRGMSE